MANAFQDKHWILDSADTTALLLGITGWINISRIRWKANADGNTVILKDLAANEKFSAEAGAKYPDGSMEEAHDYRFNPPLRMQGCILHTLGGGTLHIDLC
jgi:hypothetical protein